MDDLLLPGFRGRRPSRWRRQHLCGSRWNGPAHQPLGPQQRRPLDLLFPSSHDHNEKVDLFIYWGRSGFDPAGRTRLPSNGGKAVAIADLNQDRQPDLILVNRFNGTRSDLDSFIYWGSQGGFEPGRRTLLPTRGAEAVAVADLNGDGWKEVVFANSGLSYHVPVDRFNRSFIYWGAASGYSPDRRTSLKTVLARDVEISDLDRDGALDLVFASEGNEVEESGAWIYWGDGKRRFLRASGHQAARPEELGSGRHRP